MRTLPFTAVLAAALCFFAPVAPAYAELTPADLRCEYLTDPLAVDNPAPRLFYLVTSKQRGERQTAYRIVAATSLEKLGRDDGDLWDSGKVSSDETIHLSYRGKPLMSGQQAFWKVMVWDRAGKPSGWSKTATWTAGLLRPNDWQAKWIAYPTASGSLAEISLTGAQWIWFAGDSANAPAGKRFFRRTMTLPAGVASAQLAVSADDSYTVIVNGRRHDGPRRTDAWKSYQVFDVTKELNAGTNTIAVEATNALAGPAGLIARLVVKTSSGETLSFATDSEWQASTKADGSDSASVRLVGPLGVSPWGNLVSARGAEMTPPPHFRRPFTVNKPVKRAVLYATALGVYELSLNGQRVGTDVLSPGWTDYSKRVHYLAYDVTRQVKPGANALGAMLGDGWYASYLGYTGRRKFYGGDPKLRLQLAVEYADGSRETIATDNTWKTAFGPIQSADMLQGMVADTRRGMAGWDTAGYSDATWKTAIVVSDPGILVEAQPNEPIRPTAFLTARTRTEPKKGLFVYNFGQNLSGWVRLKVNGKPGQTITLFHGERLNPDGTLYTVNLRAARAADTYILKGGPQVIEPKFTFHGFQYMQIEGADTAAPAFRDVTAVAFHSDLRRTGKFESSNPLLDKFFENVDWGQRGNFLDVPTDCSQRDERLGWTGDAQVFAKTAMFNRDAAPFFTKWLKDLCEDGQLPDGSGPDVAPRVGGGGNAAWEDALVICTYRTYEMYGDKRVITDHWGSLTRFMEHLAKVAPDGIRQVGAFGDWLLLDGPQKSSLHGTAYYFYCAKLMAEMATATGKKEEAERYTALAARIRDVFQGKFVRDDGRVEDGGKTSQTFYALALAWNLLPEAKRPLATTHLVDLIKQRGGHLATGFIGTPVLLPALASAGRADVAYNLLLSESYPSWLYQVKLGATTTWERWDGWTPEKGFQDPGMNSFNHYWLGCVGEWVFTGVTGMDTAGAGWKRIAFRPNFTDKLTKARYSYDSIRGRIESGWERKGNETTFTVVIPANTTGIVYLPAAASNVTIDGKPTTTAASYAVEPGRYVFQFTGG